MDNEMRNCPHCGTRMAYRLGMFECLSCGYEEVPAKEEEEEVQLRSASGPGFKRTWSAPGKAPAVPPPSSLYTPGSPLGGALQGDGVVRKTGDTSLDKEKRIYFTIQLILMVLYILSYIIMAAVGYLPFYAVLGSLLGSAFGLLILWWVLFGSPRWIKVTCMGCAGIGFLGAVMSLFVQIPATLTYGMFATVQGETIFRLVFYIILFLQVAYSGWYVSILYRDVQSMDA